MSLIRTFVAVELSPDVVGRCKDVMKRLGRLTAEIRWVDPKAMHLTLKFLGDVRDREINDVCKAVAAATANLEAFDFSCAGVGAFPNLERPRTIWLGIREGSEELAKLSEAVEEELHKLGYPKERRRFSPHITIGRVQEGGRLDEALLKALESMAEFDGGQCDVSEVTVFSSELRREGPLYTALAHAELKESWRKKEAVDSDDEEEKEDEVEWDEFDELDDDEKDADDEEEDEDWSE